MRKNIEILDTYLKLGYKECLRQNIGIKDKELLPFIINRSSYTGETIYYLKTGASLFIPWDWIDLFRGLFYYEGDLVLRNTSSDYYEKFIRLFTNLQSYPIDQCTKIDGENYLEILGDVCNLGTEKFRDFLKLTYDLSYEPLEYRSLSKNFTI